MGVCQFEEVQVFRDSQQGRITWSDTQPAGTARSTPDPATYMLSAKGTCPPQDNDSYIATSGVSSGVFEALVGYWQRLQKNADQFDASFSRISPKNTELVEFRKLALDPKQKVKILELRFAPIGLSPTRKPAYGLFVEDLTGSGRVFELTMDITVQGPAVFHFDVLHP